MLGRQNRYSQIIESIFLSRHRRGDREIEFTRQDIINTAAQLAISVPQNVGDVIYSFRYRANLPQSIRAAAPAGETWIIRPAGRSRYRFALTSEITLEPNPHLAETKIPDATPGLIAMYALSDEQALLAKLRYNRLIDIFTGLTTYALQSHLRTTVPRLGQVETDEIYIGVDRRGAHFVLPVQAKGGNDRLGIVQIEQDIAMCATKFPTLVCRPIAAQFMADDLIALFELEEGPTGIAISLEKHYRLVPPEELTAEDLEAYRTRS